MHGQQNIKKKIKTWFRFSSLIHSHIIFYIFTYYEL